MRWLWSAFVVATLGCADGSPVAPSAPSVWLGRWVGGVSNEVAGIGSLRVDLHTESALGTGHTVAGTFAAAFDQSGFSDSGAAAGSHGRQQLLLTLTASARPSCPGASQPHPPAEYVVLASGVPPILTGTYVLVRCGVSSTGPIELRRE
jgi:hypothetical protein